MLYLRCIDDITHVFFFVLQNGGQISKNVIPGVEIGLKSVAEALT